jgi:hypothetical protein
MNPRKLILSTDECVSAIKSTDMIEALAFAMLIKMSFVDSTLKYAPVRELKTKLHMGSAKLNRVLANAMKYGYIVKTDAGYFAPSLKRNKSFNRRIEFMWQAFDGSTIYKINSIVKIIRKVVLENHLRKQQSFSDTASKVAAPNDLREYTRSRARLKRMCGQTTVSEEQVKTSQRLSNNRAMEIMYTKRSTAKKLIREMIAAGEIERKFNNIPLGMSIKEYEQQFEQARTQQNIQNIGGYLFGWHGAVYIRVANSYVCTEKLNNQIFYSVSL